MDSSEFRSRQFLELRRKKGSYQGELTESAFSLSAKMDPITYANTFNAHVNNLKLSEYKSRNPQLFTWDQRQQYMNRLSPSPELVKIHDLHHSSIADKQISLPDEVVGFGSASTLKKRSDSTTQVFSNQSLKSQVGTIDNRTRSKTPTVRSKKFVGLHVDTNPEQLVSESPIRSKSSYLVSRLQTKLLSRTPGPQSTCIPNSQYMLNHFDKRNLPINRIISQLNTNKDFLDPENIKKETISKIEYVSKPYTASSALRTGQSREINLSKSQAKQGSGLFREKMRNPTIDLEHSAKPDIPYDRKDLELSFGRLSPIEDENGYKGLRMQNENCEKLCVRRKIDMRDAKVLKKRKEEIVAKQKDNKWLVRNLADGIHYVDSMSGIKSVKCKKTEKIEKSVEGHKRAPSLGNIKIRKLKGEIFEAKTEAYDEETPFGDNVQLVWNPDKDNIFYYGTYFRQKYAEQDGTYMDVSSELKTRIVKFGKEIKKSMKQIHLIDFKTPGNYKLIRANTSPILALKQVVSESMD